jgi:Uma2 family endonuclease
MSALAAQVPSTRDDAPCEDHWVVLRGMTWADWRRHQEARGDRSAPRLAYLDGVLQIMSPSRDHERIKSYLGRLVETWALSKGIRLVPLGSWTLEAEGQEAGAEPNECYQIGPEEKPKPDLAIEVVWTSGGLSKLQIYQRLRVPEVWTWRKGTLSVHVLRDGAFVAVPRSEVFPELDLQLILSLLDQPTLYDAQQALLHALRTP